jgi:hypothetical protein
MLTIVEARAGQRRQRPLGAADLISHQFRPPNHDRELVASLH